MHGYLPIYAITLPDSGSLGRADSDTLQTVMISESNGQRGAKGHGTKVPFRNLPKGRIKGRIKTPKYP
jgi:hypothetical protein